MPYNGSAIKKNRPIQKYIYCTPNIAMVRKCKLLTAARGGGHNS